jgi:hypothetical protein
MNVGPVGQFLQFFDKLLKLLAIEFVVAEHVNDRPVRKTLQGPLQAVAAGADVASKNYCVSLDSRWGKRLKLKVQVAERRCSM